jgi:hypothetical protein
MGGGQWRRVWMLLGEFFGRLVTFDFLDIFDVW